MTNNYTVEERDGAQVLVYEDGTVKDAATGHFLHPPRSAKITTSERGRELGRRRKELAQQRAIEGIDEAAIEAGKIPQHHAGSGDGWKAVVKHIATTLLESKNLRGQAEAANFLGKASGNTLETEGSEMSNIADAITTLLEGLLEKRREEVIEGKVTDVNR